MPLGDMGGGGGKNLKKVRDVLCERPLIVSQNNLPNPSAVQNLLQNTLFDVMFFVVTFLLRHIPYLSLSCCHEWVFN